MAYTDVRIVTLPPMRVASSLGYGATPEMFAWEKILAWAERHGALTDPAARWFGFNNPSPSAGSPNYGYEQWVTVGPDAQPEGDVEIKEFGGGLYAVSRCTLEHIFESWQALVAWRERNGYRASHHQWLEESINPPRTGAAVGANEAVMDLYLPIAELRR
jgi:DNA gyrase inhibitor GyrI